VKLSINPAGIVKDINAAELGMEAWNDGDNVLFRNGFAVSPPGWASAVGTTLFRPLWILPFYTPVSFYWLYVGNNDAEDAGGVGVTDGTTHWDITPAGGLSVMKAGDITGGVLNSVAFINNGIDPPQYWDSQILNPMVELPGWPVAQVCKAMRAFKYHLIAMNISDGTGDYPELVAWSSAADPGQIPQTWVPDPANDAGNFTIAATTGGVVDGLSLRDQFIVYKQHSTTVMQYIAGQFVFSNRAAFATSGILARNCAQELYGAHYVITDGDIIKHNGQEVTSLIDQKLKTHMFDQIDPESYPGSFMAASHADKEIWCCFPKAGHTYSDTAMVYDINSGGWGLSELPDVPFMARGIINNQTAPVDYEGQTDSYDTIEGRYNQRRFNPTSDILVMAQPADKTFLAHGGFTRSGELVKLFMAMYSKDFGEAQRIKLITAIWPHVEAERADPNGAYYLRAGYQFDLADSIAWSDKIAITGAQFNKADFLVSGRYISFELSGDQANVWRLNSLDIDYELQGMW